MRRVVVTGIGVVSPNGIGREAFSEAIVEGRSGIGPLTRFDTTGFALADRMPTSRKRQRRSRRGLRR